MKAWAIAAVLVSGVTFSGTSLRVYAAGDPYQIFGRARSVFAQQRYPDYLSYTVTVRVNERGVEKVKHYHLAYDARTQKIYVNPVSDEERTNPPDPNGMTFHLLPRRQFKVIYDKQVGNPGDAVDPLGVPEISPTYSFGMSATSTEGPDDSGALVQEIRNEYKDPTPPATQREIATDGKLKTIALVASYERRYIVTLQGIESIDGNPCYHLSLKPVHPSASLRLRDLWIDTQTYQTRRLVSAGNFTGSGVPWAITFADVNGALYIASETAMASVGVGMHHYQQASVSFDDITPQTQPPANLSGWFVTKEKIMAEPDTPGAPQQ
jgi:hypothetical protein